MNSQKETVRMTDQLFKCPWCGGVMDEEHPYCKEAADEMHEREAEAAAQVAALTARVAELEEVLDECETYFDNRADAEYFTDSPFPVGNEEMGLLVTVRKAKKGSDA